MPTRAKIQHRQSIRPLHEFHQIPAGQSLLFLSDLEKAGIDCQKVEIFFEQLKTDCFVQQHKLNDEKTDPNKKPAIQHVTIIHNVDKPASLE